jgi:tetratricopeptide (TPR) repeat protein
MWSRRRVRPSLVSWRSDSAREEHRSTLSPANLQHHHWDAVRYQLAHSITPTVGDILNVIYEAIEHARTAASNFPVPLDVPTASLTLDQMMIGSIHVDGWLKVNAYGLFIDANRTPFQTLELGLPMDEIGYNYSIKADRYDRDLTDIFSVQDELTREIVSTLKIKLTAEEKGRLVHKRAVDFEAYNLFLRGREQAWITTRSGNLEARNLLGRAVAIDQDFAAAHAYIGFTHLNDCVNGWADVPEQSLKTGLEITARAVAMDPEDPQAHFALSVAFIWNREHDKALAEAQRCLALAPSSAEGHLAIARIQIYSGNAAEAIDTINAYMRLDPLYPVIALHFLAEAHVALGHFEQAVAALKQRL